VLGRDRGGLLICHHHLDVLFQGVPVRCFTVAIMAFILATVLHGVIRSTGTPGFFCPALYALRIFAFACSSLSCGMVMLPFQDCGLDVLLKLSFAGFEAASWRTANARGSCAARTTESESERRIFVIFCFLSMEWNGRKRRHCFYLTE